MEEQKPVSKADRKRKLLFVLPLFFIPFVLLLLYTVGVGKSAQANIPLKPGLNMNLPSAQIDESKPVDKLSLYKQADDDSARKRIYATTDPFGQGLLYKNPGQQVPQYLASPYEGNQPWSMPQNQAHNSLAQNETRVQEKLAALQHVLNSQPAVESQVPAQGEPFSVPSLPVQLNSPGGATHAADPEIGQLNSMLDKVLDVQHPERVKERTKAASEKEPGQAFPVIKTDPGLDKWPAERIHDDTTSSRAVKKNGNTFLGLDDNPADDATPNAIKAVVHETQVLVSGSTIKLRLDDDIYVHGQLIPAGTFIFGTCDLSGERLKVAITKITYGQNIYPVSLKVYDNDGLEGIHVPGSISRDATKEGTDEAIQSLQLASLNPSLGAQAAATGMETVRSLLQKKIRLIKVTVKTDHPVLLMSGSN